MDVSLIAGAVSTALFAASMVPMLRKAARTHDLGSYSLANLVTINIANIVHSVYVFALPIGPIWVLHGFYLVASALMLTWWLRYRSASSEPLLPDVVRHNESKEEVSWTR